MQKVDLSEKLIVYNAFFSIIVNLTSCIFDCQLQFLARKNMADIFKKIYDRKLAKTKKKVKKFPLGIELGTFCVEVRTDNHYTTKTSYGGSWLINR